MALAVNKAGATLFKIGFGAALLAVMFTSWSFWFFDEDANNYSNQCNTAYQCILYGIHWGLRGDLAKSWGPIPNPSFNAGFPQSVSDENSLAFQWLLVLAYKIIWRFVFIGILTATIVGAFGAIRGKIAADANDEANKCLICSLSRFVLEQEGGGFSQHTANHHNPWSYLAFLSKLKIGNEDDFTGLESCVDVKSRKGDHTFIPVGLCTEIQALRRRQDQQSKHAAATAENNADGTAAYQKKITKALDTINAATGNLSVDLPADFQTRLETIEESMSSMMELVIKLSSD